MKKVVSAILAVLSVVSVLTFTTFSIGAQETTPVTSGDYEYTVLSDGTAQIESLSDNVHGDVSGDGVVTVSDATLIQRHIAQLSFIEESREINADVSGDGDVTVVDATIIQRFVAHLIPSL